MPREPIITIDGTNFRLDNKPFDTVDLQLTFSNPAENLVVTVYDDTYDKSITFATLITTEEDILNVDYDPNNYERFKPTEIELGSNFGSWEFGKDEFGNQVTVVKTEKLSGKGHNIKVTFVDFSKSKWTLETLGTTYKMRKARRR
jgi:hypothetical protein